MESPPWAIEALYPNVHRLTFSDRNLRVSGREIRILLTADRHIDSPHSDLARQRRHLQQAMDANAPVLDLGDVFDAMQSRHDKRRARRDLIPYLQGRDDYVTGLVEYGTDVLSPYSDVLALVARGNHETAVHTHNGVDLLNSLAYRLKAENPKCPVHIGGYTGWLLVTLKDMKPNGSSWTHTVRVKYTHGHGGAAKMTKGTLEVVRRSAIYPQADVIVAGHIHQNWTMAIGQERISRQGRPYVAECLHVSVPSYKDEHKDGQGGYAVEKGYPPTVVGAFWLVLTLVSHQVGGGKANQYKVHVDAVRAH